MGFDPDDLIRPRFAEPIRASGPYKTALKDPMRAGGGKSSVSAAETTLEDIDDDAGPWRTSHPCCA